MKALFSISARLIIKTLMKDKRTDDVIFGDIRVGSVIVGHYKQYLFLRYRHAVSAFSNEHNVYICCPHLSHFCSVNFVRRINKNLQKCHQNCSQCSEHVGAKWRHLSDNKVFGCPH